MSGSEELRLPKMQGDHQQFERQSPDRQQEARPKSECESRPNDIQHAGQDEAERNEAQGGKPRFSQSVHHPRLSLIVTLACGVLCAAMPMLAAFFSLAFVFTVFVLTPFADRLKAENPLGRALDLLSRGRLIAMSAAVALDPELSAEQVRFLVGLPLDMLIEAVPPGLNAALVFTILCAMQTGIAAVMMFQAIPSRRIYAASLRAAELLPADMAGRMSRRIVLAEQRFNSITAETDR